MDCDQRIDRLTFGKWHLVVFGQILWAVLIMSSINASVIFMEDVPPYVCKSPLLSTNWTFNQIQQISSPLDAKGKFHSCKVFDVDFRQWMNVSFDIAKTQLNQSSTPSVKCNSGFDFYHGSDGMHYSVVSQWSLVCDDKVQNSNMAFIYMAGFFFGCLLSGPLADKMGRKPVIIVALMITLVLGVVDPLMPSFAVFMVGRFFIGVFNGGCSGVIYVLAMELLNKGQRTFLGSVYFITFAFGYALVPVVAWAFRDWRYMHIAFAVPYATCIAFIWILPESPRWLISKGRESEAQLILDNAFQWNNVKVHSDISLRSVSKNIEDEKKGDELLKPETLMDLRHYPKLIIQTVNVFLNWLCNGLVYYGISLLITSFAGDIFINNAIAALVEIPGYLMCLPLLWWARKKSLMVCLLGAGVSILLYLAIPSSGYTWAQLLIAFIGKFFVTASFNLVYVVTVEIYPTSIRGSMLTLGSMSARIGSMIAPYINSAAEDDDVTTPMIVFGSVSLVAGILTWWIPESQNKKLPETMNQARDITLK